MELDNKRKTMEKWVENLNTVLERLKSDSRDPDCGWYAMDNEQESLREVIEFLRERI